MLGKIPESTPFSNAVSKAWNDNIDPTDVNSVMSGLQDLQLTICAVVAMYVHNNPSVTTHTEREVFSQGLINGISNKMRKYIIPMIEKYDLAVARLDDIQGGKMKRPSVEDSLKAQGVVK